MMKRGDESVTTPPGRAKMGERMLMIERGREPLTLSLSPSEGEREAVLGACGTLGSARGVVCPGVICGTPLGVLRVIWTVISQPRTLHWQPVAMPLQLPQA